MTFQSPLWLFLLLAVAALVGLYVLLQLRRKRYAARFTNVELLGSLVPKRPGWRRHVAFGLVAVLVSLAGTIRAREVLRLDYATRDAVPEEETTSPPRRVEPHHLVSTEGRWYLPWRYGRWRGVNAS